MRTGLLLLLIIFPGCLGPVAGLYPPQENQPSTVIYVVDHGWHTGVVIPRIEIPPDLWPEQTDFLDFDYLEVGWGDEGFYRAQKITIGLALRAIFIPTPSILHIVGVNAPIDQYFYGSDIIEVELSGEGFRELCSFIDSTFDRGDNSRTTPLGPGIYGPSLFYRASGYYYFPKTCNVWTARAIRRAGAPITPFYAITADNVLYQTSKFGTVIQRMP